LNQHCQEKEDVGPFLFTFSWYAEMCKKQWGHRLAILCSSQPS